MISYIVKEKLSTFYLKKIFNKSLKNYNNFLDQDDILIWNCKKTFIFNSFSTFSSLNSKWIPETKENVLKEFKLIKIRIWFQDYLESPGTEYSYQN